MNHQNPISMERHNICHVWCKSFKYIKFEMYAGKQPERPYNLINAASDVVVRLTQIYNSGRNMTADNFFASIGIIKKWKIENFPTYGPSEKKRYLLAFKKLKVVIFIQVSLVFLKLAILVSYISIMQRNVYLYQVCTWINLSIVRQERKENPI